MHPDRQEIVNTGGSGRQRIRGRSGAVIEGSRMFVRIVVPFAVRRLLAACEASASGSRTRLLDPGATFRAMFHSVFHAVFH
jgi:hypothetical protein